MKNNQPVTQVEKHFAESETLISTTDPKGVVTSVNDSFTKVSEFTADELVGASHNIVRHPDMPSEAFTNLWETLKAGKAWVGVVKNRSKGGDHYWVDAYIAPIVEKGQITGFQSVRMRAQRDDVQRCEALYRELRETKRIRERFGNVRYSRRIFVGGGLATAVLILGLIMAGALSGTAGTLALIAGLGFHALVAYLIALPLAAAADSTRAIVDNPMTQVIYSGGVNEVSQLIAAHKMLQAKLRTVVARVGNYSEELRKHTQDASRIADDTTAGIDQQLSETEQVISAITQMAATAQEVARNASTAAAYVKEANEKTLAVKKVIFDTIDVVEELVRAVENASGVIGKLKEDSASIGTVVDVIREIAEQTNLLALNAAIEAARAGEQGRGFAVVADEVRTLATRTQSSTVEIQNIIERLQAGTGNAVAAMQEGQAKAHQGVEQAIHAGKSLEDIVATVEQITDMNVQIAAAAEQQSAVTEELNRNVDNIRNVVTDTAEGARSLAANSRGLSTMTDHLQTLVKQCSL